MTLQNTLGADAAEMRVRGAGTLLVFASERPARVDVGLEEAAWSWDETSRLVRVAVSALEEDGCTVVLRFDSTGVPRSSETASL